MRSAADGTQHLSVCWSDRNVTNARLSLCEMLVRSHLIRLAPTSADCCCDSSAFSWQAAPFVVSSEDCKEKTSADRCKYGVKWGRSPRHRDKEILTSAKATEQPATESDNPYPSTRTSRTEALAANPGYCHAWSTLQLYGAGSTPTHRLPSPGCSTHTPPNSAQQLITSSFSTLALRCSSNSLESSSSAGIRMTMKSLAGMASR